MRAVAIAAKVAGAGRACVDSIIIEHSDRTVVYPSHRSKLYMCTLQMILLPFDGVCFEWQEDSRYRLPLAQTRRGMCEQGPAECKGVAQCLCRSRQG